MVRQCAIAAVVLGGLLLSRITWYWFSGVAQWWIWDACQAVEKAVAFAAIWHMTRNEVLRPVLGLAVGLTMLTAFAGFWWAFSPVQPLPGKESFDAIIGWPASLLVLLLFVVAAMHISKKGRQTNAAADKP
jgi:hypothetical protein